MKNILRCSLVFLALSTAGLFAETITQSTDAPAVSHQTGKKISKKGKKGAHKKHKKRHVKKKSAT